MNIKRYQLILHRTLFFPLLAMFGMSPVVGAESHGDYLVVKHNLPQVLQPGQLLMGQISVEVMEPGTVPYDRPFASLHSTVDPKRNLDLSADKMNPWQMPQTQKKGDILVIGFSLDVPLDFPPGPADIGLVIAKNEADKGWTYADILDGNGTVYGGKRFRWPVKIGPENQTNDKNIEVPLVVIQMVPPVLDGRVEPDEWKPAEEIPEFKENFNKTLKGKTSGFIGHDDKYLYLAFICEEPIMGKITQNTLVGRDSAIYVNECIEIFLNPQADRSSFMQFIVDIVNQHYDALGSDPYGFNPPWQSMVHKGENFWSVEMAIPFTSLGVKSPTVGEFWYANFARERKAEEELSAWQPTFGSFAAPGRFGMLVFDSFKAYFENRIQGLEEPAAQWPASMTEITANWQKKLQSLKQRITDANDRDLASAFASFDAEIETLKKELAGFQIKVMQLAQGTLFLVTRSLPYEPFFGKLSDLDRPVESVAVTLFQGEWVDLAWNVMNLSDRPLALRFTTRYGEPNESFKLGLPGLTTLWQQALPVAAGDGRVTWDAISPIPAGVIQVPPGQSSQVWLSVQAPRQASGNFSGHLVIEPIDSATCEWTTIPLTVRVIPVSLTEKSAIHQFTWNFGFAEPSQRTWSRIHLEDLAAHGVDVCMISGLRFLSRPKANSQGDLIDPLNFAQIDELLDLSQDLFHYYYITIDIFEKGVLRNDLFGLGFDDPGYEKAFKTWLKTVVSHIKSKGISEDRLLINSYDESVDKNYQMISRWIKEVFPQVMIIANSCTDDPVEAKKLQDQTDIWMPHYKHFFFDPYQPFLQMIKSAKKPVWCYFYSEGSNEKAQHPAKHYLVKFWWAFANQVTGMSYWAQQYYGDPWTRTRVDHLGMYDTSLVYPTEGGLIPSRRWQAWRQGWQDHCLLTLTSEYLTRKGDSVSLAKMKQLVDEVVLVPGDPNRSESVRNWCKHFFLEQSANTPTSSNNK